MAQKMVNVDKDKWKAFKRWCNNHDTTIKVQIDKFLDKFSQGVEG